MTAAWKPKNRRPVVQLDPTSYKLLNRYESILLGSKGSGISLSSIRRMCVEHSLNVKGTRWMYADEYDKSAEAP